MSPYSFTIVVSQGDRNLKIKELVLFVSAAFRGTLISDLVFYVEEKHSPFFSIYFFPAQSAGLSETKSKAPQFPFTVLSVQGRDISESLF